MITKLSVKLEPAGLGDIERVLDTESMTAPNPFNREAYENFILNKGHTAVARAQPNNVVGHVLYNFPSRPFLLVHKFAVRPGYRRQGVGQQMLDRMVRKGRALGRRLLIPVWEHDLDMQLFLQSHGMRCFVVGNKGYYSSDPESSVYWFSR